MKHGRADYDRIQDPAGLIPADEPVFLLRGQDRFAPVVIAAWAALLKAIGQDAIADLAESQMHYMRAWQIEHAVKTPDAPDEAFAD